MPYADPPRRPEEAGRRTFYYPPNVVDFKWWAHLP